MKTCWLLHYVLIKIATDVPVWWEALQSEKGYTIFFFPSLDKRTSLCGVSSYVKMEHICAAEWFILKFNSSVASFSHEILISAFKHITSCVCDKGWESSRVYKCCDISLVPCLQILKWSGALRAAALLQIRVQERALFITSQGAKIRWCLAAALPATADSIKAKRDRLETGLSVWCCAILSLPFVSPRRWQQPRPGFSSL